MVHKKNMKIAVWVCWWQNKLMYGIALLVHIYIRYCTFEISYRKKSVYVFLIIFFIFVSPCCFIDVIISCDCNGTRTHNRLVCKRTLNHLAMASFASLAKWLSVRLRTKWLWVRVPLQSLKHYIFVINIMMMLQRKPLELSQSLRNQIIPFHIKPMTPLRKDKKLIQR